MFSKLTSLAIVSLAVALPMASAEGCFGGQQGNCGSAIAGFCSGKHSPDFNHAETRSQCYNSGSVYKCDLKVERTASGSGTYDYNDCYNAMTEMNTQCDSRGGIYTLNGFEYTVDPNLGSC